MWPISCMTIDCKGKEYRTVWETGNHQNLPTVAGSIIIFLLSSVFEIVIKRDK